MAKVLVWQTLNDEELMVFGPVQWRGSDLVEQKVRGAVIRYVRGWRCPTDFGIHYWSPTESTTEGKYLRSSREF